MALDQEEVGGRLTALLADEDRVRFTYLFGSVARGRTHRASDVDVAVFITPGLDAGARFRLRLDLAGRLAGELGVEVDVIDVEHAPLSVQHQVLRQSRIVLERDRAERINFEIASRRSYLDIEELEGLSPVSPDEFLKDLGKRRHAERALQLAIEACLDIGSHLISELRLREPESNRDIFFVLVESGILEQEKRDAFATMAGFRDILVRGYARVDPGQVHRALQHGIADLRHFARRVKDRFLQA